MQLQTQLASRHELQRQLGDVLPDADRSLGIPPACYADDGLLALERHAIFLSGWVGLGRSDRWPKKGDYSAMDIAGEPVIVVRGKAGDLKAFQQLPASRQPPVGGRW